MTTIHFLAVTITKNTWKNLIFVRVIYLIINDDKPYSLLIKYKQKLNVAPIIIKIHVENNHC
jgi:hypothetical protein